MYPNLDTTKTTGKEGDGRSLPRVEWMNGKQITRENNKQNYGALRQTQSCKGVMIQVGLGHVGLPHLAHDS